MGGRSVWADKADQIMADAQWHNGPKLVWELMKRVPAGLALRELEAERVIARAGGSEAVEELALENPDEPRALLLHRLREEHPRRSKRVSEDALIEAGQAKIIRSLVRERIRNGRWETRNLDWPPTREQWRRGDWEVRDTHSLMRTLTQLADGYAMSTETLRRVINDYGIPVVASGRVTRVYIDHIVDLDRAVEKFKSELRIARTRSLLEIRRRHLQEELDRQRHQHHHP
jgi:hypothetical protein